MRQVALIQYLEWFDQTKMVALDLEISTDQKRYRSDQKENLELVILVCIEKSCVLINVPKNGDAVGIRDADVKFVWLGIPLDVDDIATLASETCLLDAFGTQHLPLVPMKWLVGCSGWL
jgi:hypothetical protein